MIRPIDPARVLSSSEGRHCRIGKKGAIALEQCPLRRRRDGATVQARTKEQSSARVRVLSRKKASRSFQRRHPSRDGAREGPWPKRNGMWSSRPRHDFESVTRMPRTRREGYARVRPKSARLTFSRAVLIRNLPLHASGSRRAQAVVSRLRLTGSRCGNASQGQRNRHPLVPACSGARAPLACEDRNARRVCSCVVTRLQKSASDAQV